VRACVVDVVFRAFLTEVHTTIQTPVEPHSMVILSFTRTEHVFKVFSNESRWS
jgi:hypothetical protein